MESKQHKKMINESWQRCRDFGLDHDTEPELERLERADTGVLLDIHQRLINTTDHAVLPYYDNILNNSPCLILLADSRGNVLNSWGEKRFVSNLDNEWFAAGASWREVSTGTNAIGTALTTGEAVQVQRDEHYLKRHRYMIGSASPIFDTNNELLAVLDISSDTYMPQAHTLGMVRLMSQSIENCLLIEKYYHDNFILTINTHFDNLDSQWSGLIVINLEGRIVACNRRAEQLLDFKLIGINVDQLLDFKLDVLTKQQSSRPFELRLLNKYSMYAKIQKPERNSIYSHSSSKVDLPKKTAVSTGIDFEHLQFGDRKLAKAIAQAKKIVEKDIPILIHGETGVGKEVFVKALHQHSSRADQPLVALNCAAIPADLVESELFGYVKGAFTGADTKGSIGLVRQANNGILFLDEIGDMPLNVQGRLLRVLQERKVTPLGASQAYPVNVKLVSATNCNLKDLVNKELFRKDLFYRVSGLNIELPSLRNREDKQKLFEHIIRNKSDNNAQASLDNTIMQLFLRHPWPGNIRQFISVLDVALAMADEEPIEHWHLADDFFEDLEGGIDNQQESIAASINIEAVNTSSVENQADNTSEILDCYKQCNGNLTKTAKMLGVSRNTLYKKLRELGLK
jgi:transcriptional regulator of acetoin/glycerol metabolism